MRALHPSPFVAVVAALALVGCTSALDEPSLDRHAFDLPLLASHPTIDGVLDDPLWRDALRWEGTFVLDRYPNLTGEHPFHLMIAAQERALLVGVRLWGLDPNPEYPPGDDAGEWINLLLTTDTSALRPPADALFAANHNGNGTAVIDGYWDGQKWQQQVGTDLVPIGSETEFGRNADTAYDGTTHTWEFLVPRTSDHPEGDGFQVPGPGVFGLRLEFMRQAWKQGSWPDDVFMDRFPRSGPPPGSLTDLDEWLWLRFPS